MKKFIFVCPECKKVIFMCQAWQIKKKQWLEKFTMAFLNHYEKHHPDIAAKANPWNKKDAVFPFIQGGRACGR